MSIVQYLCIATLPGFAVIIVAAAVFFYGEFGLGLKPRTASVAHDVSIKALIYVLLCTGAAEIANLFGA